MHKHHNISLHLVDYVLNVRPRGHWIGIDEASPTSAKENIKTNEVSGDAFMGNRHIEHMLTKGGGARSNPQGMTVQQF